jgi:hypothetical protein
MACGAPQLAPSSLGGSTVTANHLTSWVSDEPGGKGFSTGILKQIDRDLLLQVNQERAIALTFAPCPLVSP